MSGLGGDKTSYRKTPHHHDDPLVLLERIRAKPDSRTETDSGYSDSVVEGVNSTQPISWGRLLRLDVSKGSGIDLADRHGNFPASRPQGYIVGRDYECDLVIDHPSVSNRHCLIYRVIRNGQVCVFLRDLSSNGTYVNQTLVGCNKVVELKDGDKVMIVAIARFLFQSSGPIRRTFDQQYMLLGFIREGRLGKVFVCKEKSTGERFAVKKHEFSPNHESDWAKKVNIVAELNLMGLSHKNIMSMKEAFADNSSSAHVTQFAQRGELFDLIVRKSKLSEDDTRHIFKQLFDAVKYLHDRNIVHRDLKPENILIVDEENSIMLCSFDLSITISPENFDTTLCGTPTYIAPEILADTKDRKYGREVDIWSLGVVLYTCLCGFPPFSDDLYSKDFPYTLCQQIRSAKFYYPSPYWDSVGDPALDLIDKMIVLGPESRLTIDQCIAHPWLTQIPPGQELFARTAPVLHRKPTLLGSGQVAPSSTYFASSRELQVPGPARVYSPPASTIMTSETVGKGKGKISSPLLKNPETQEQNHSKYQNLFGKPQRNTANTKMIEDIGNYLQKLSLDKKFSKKPVERAILPMALDEANNAVQLDNAQNFRGAISAYRETCELLYQLVLRTKAHEDKTKLEAILKTYATRIEELSDLLAGEEKDRFPLFPRESSVWPRSPGLRSVMAKHAVPESVAASPARTFSDSIKSLDYDEFAKLINSATNIPKPPWIRSTQVLEDLQSDIEFNYAGQDSSSWTCTPSNSVPSDEIPLRVDGHPVVLPVDFKYPLTGIPSPPPDPHPLFISPSSQLSDEDIHHILSTFPACVGFYVLVNGFLQVIMPDDFDYEEGVPSLPNEFGGLKVSLIPETVCPTAGEASASSPATTATSTKSRFERLFSQSSAQNAVAGSAGHPSTSTAGVSVGCAVRAIVPGSKSKQRFEGKTGVAIIPRDDNTKKYVTIPTHLLTDAVIASKTMSLDSDTWRKDVKVCVASNSVELGEVTTMFDQEPKSFPVGFSHDVSLVDISRIADTPRMIPYAADLTWLSQQEWMDIKYNSSNLVLLDDRSREAKSIGVVDSRCQMVGQGIFRIQQQSRKRSSFLGSLSSGSSSSRAQDPRDDPSTWTSLVARSILYRVHPDYPARGGQSGVPVCVVSESTDGAAPRSVKVAGFASFVQMVSDVQKYDLEGDKLYKRLQEGRVAFYGAFQVPQELREGYQIL